MHLLHAGPGIKFEKEFECFCHYGNCVAMDDAEINVLKYGVDKNLPKRPFYVCTINKSNTLKEKAKMVKLLN